MPQIYNTRSEYGAVAKAFHWLMFILIAGLLTAGLLMTGMENSPDKFFIYGLHKSFGIIVLLLAALRLIWKIRSLTPELPNAMSKLDKRAAHGAHWLLYALMFALPLSGWAMSSAAGFPVSVFGLFTLPDLAAPDKILKGIMHEAHWLLAYALMAIISVHAAAALWHHFYHRDNVLRRMLPFVRSETINAQDIDTGAGR